VRKYTLKQAAQARRVHVKTIYRWLKLGIIPDRRPPGARKIIILHDDLFTPRTAITELRAA